jgi:hypothetical protein
VDSIIKQDLHERPAQVAQGPKPELGYEWKQTYVSQPLPLHTGEADVSDFISATAVLADFGHCESKMYVLVHAMLIS